MRRLVLSILGRCAFMRLPFWAASDSLSILSCMEIWMIVTKGDIIRTDKLLYLYRLKESKEFRYYKLVPWDRKACHIVSLPSLFRYWKSRYFFISGDGWETFSDDLWGDIPRLLCRWGTPKLGVSSFIFFFFLKVFTFGSSNSNASHFFVSCNQGSTKAKE